MVEKGVDGSAFEFSTSTVGNKETLVENFGKLNHGFIFLPKYFRINSNVSSKITFLLVNPQIVSLCIPDKLKTTAVCGGGWVILKLGRKNILKKAGCFHQIFRVGGNFERNIFHFYHIFEGHDI